MPHFPPSVDYFAGMKRKLEELAVAADAILKDAQAKVVGLFEYRPTLLEEISEHPGEEYAFLPDVRHMSAWFVSKANVCPIFLWEPGYTYRAIDVAISCRIKFGGYKFHDIEKVKVSFVDSDLSESVCFPSAPGYTERDIEKRIAKTIRGKKDLDGRDDSDSAWATHNHTLTLLGVTWNPVLSLNKSIVLTEFAPAVIFSSPPFKELDLATRVQGTNEECGSAFCVKHVRFELPCTFLPDHDLLIPQGPSIDVLVHESVASNNPCFRLASTFCYSDTVKVSGKSAHCEYFVVLKM
jgi:hypothetical protein